MQNTTTSFRSKIKKRLKKEIYQVLRLNRIEDQLKHAEEAIENLKNKCDTYSQELAEISHASVMPKYLFHSPQDYFLESHPPKFEPSIVVPGERIPLPPALCRPGYSPDDDVHYLRWGKSDHDVIKSVVKKHRGLEKDMSILDFGCSSGRVLRHFDQEHIELGWKLKGIDIQAFLVEWVRQNFPIEFEVACGSTYPHLPYPDNSIDILFGISVFTHTKFLWDMWLLEFKRVLKPRGLCIQTVQCEPAWEFYHKNREVEWVKGGHPESMLLKPKIDEDYFLYGDAFCSQTFYKESVLKEYWGRYLKVIDFLPPQNFGYQNWIVTQKE